MDWDLKVPTLDSAELEQDTMSVIISADITSSSIPDCQGKGSNCSVDLRLCQLGDFESPNKWKEQLGVPTPAVPPSGSLKTIRSRGGGNQTVSCSVDGCKSDLSKCKEYHRRHKVCQAHSKTPVVLVAGKELRFCQQCSRKRMLWLSNFIQSYLAPIDMGKHQESIASRFHSLVEFDEVKQSCRKRLDGHNRRRRKPCPDLTNSGSLLINLQGQRFLSYPHVFPNSVSGSEWTSMAKLEDDMLHRSHQHFHLPDDQKVVPGFHSYKNERQIPFSQDNLAQAVPKASSSSDTSKTIFLSGGQTQVLNSNRAFSLLSPQVLQKTPFSIEIPTAQPLIQSSRVCNNLHIFSHPQASGNVTATGFSSSQIVDDQISTVTASDVKDAGLNCHDFFNVGSDESSHTPHFLPFSWS